MIGIIGAMDEEIYEIKNLMKIEKEIKIFDVIFYQGFLGSKEVCLVKSKIGKVAAGFVTTLLFNNFEIDYLINIGTCGACSSELKYLDIVVSDKVLYHDADVRAFGYEFGQMAQAPSYFQANEDLICKAKRFPNIFIGDMICGDEFVNDHSKMQAKINEYFGKYNIMTVDMESAAIAHISYLANKDFVIIRTISDVLDFDGDKRDFGELALESCKILANFVKEYVCE